MPIELLSVSLLVLPVFVAIALTIAVAGHRNGSRGARTAAFTMWVLLGLVQPILWGALHSPVASWMLSLVVAAVSVALIFVPLKSLSRFSWTRGRMVGGLVGATVIALIYPSLVLILGCMTGIDCI